jgi:ABC-type branched-subunit amino acid transport system substrate-binding protein
VERKIKPTDADLTAQVTALRGARAKAVMLTTTPTQTASALGVAQASGFDGTFVGSNPSFSPALLNGPVKDALQKRLLVVNSIAPFSGREPGPTQVRNAFLAKFPNQPKTQYVMYGYAQGALMAKLLGATCNNLTRAGLLAAFRGMRDVRTEGLVAPLDYSTPGTIPARQTYIMRPDAGVEGGLAQVQDLFAAPLAATYKPAR